MTRSPLLALLLLAACADRAAEPFEARGTVEVPEADLSIPITAMVISVLVEEGAAIRQGDTLARLTVPDLDATLATQRARIATATANLRDVSAGSRPQEIRRAEAELAAAQAEVERAAKDAARLRDLVAKDLESRQALDHAVAAELAAGGRRDAAAEALQLLQAGSRPERISAARGEVQSAEAVLGEMSARFAALVLLAPRSGVVLSRNAEPGEVLPGGTPVLTVGETARPYVRVFLPQWVVSRLRVGDTASVLTGDGRTLSGRVAAINPRAEFTPRVALTERERDDLMFGVKLEFEKPAEAPSPGLWVRVRIGRTGGQAVGRQVSP